jgi:hypothetical protein
MLIGLSCQLRRRMAHQFLVALRGLRAGNAMWVFLKTLEKIAVICPAISIISK